MWVPHLFIQQMHIIIYPLQFSWRKLCSGDVFVKNKTRRIVPLSPKHEWNQTVIEIDRNGNYCEPHSLSLIYKSSLEAAACSVSKETCAFALSLSCRLIAFRTSWWCCASIAAIRSQPRLTFYLPCFNFLCARNAADADPKGWPRKTNRRSREVELVVSDSIIHIARLLPRSLCNQPKFITNSCNLFYHREMVGEETSDANEKMHGSF